MLVENKFACRIKAIPPVQSCLKKYSASCFPQITSIFPPSPPDKRGVSRSSRTLDAGCGGRGLRQATNDVDLAYGEVVWA
jgi:hypothetical protein